MGGEQFPLVVLNGDGTVAALGRTNRKAVAKSVERGELWYLHADTERVLPWNGGGTAFVSLDQRQGAEGSVSSWYEATLTVSSPEENRKSDGSEAANGTGQSAAGIDSTPTPNRTRAGEVLSHLQDVVAARRRDLPEGSYTTHLFTEGVEKIRKKTGEEAVELILARDAGEVTYEAADLIYHLLVLLEAEEIPFGEVLTELERRF